MSDAIQVVTTTAERADADRIARALVEQRLAACVQVSGPITSSYWWNGKIESSTEWLCTAKTIHILYPDIEQAIRVLHPYNEPEILAIPVIGVSQSYLKWLEDEVRRPSK
jgi:periplasmic divalent cation tolerance protein